MPRSRAVSNAAAKLAEQLGFDDVWVSDHLVIPEGQSYPAPMLCDPLTSLAFAAAATDSVGLGTSVLVGPQYTSPLALANSLASLDYLSDGRLTVGIGIGWSQAEYEALHAPFDHRGERLDEMIDLFRTAWRDDPATHDGRYYSFSNIHVQPQPAHDVPIWIGGASDAAFARAFAKADGYHGIGVEPEQAAALVERIRAGRPEDDVHDLAPSAVGCALDRARRDQGPARRVRGGRDPAPHGCAHAREHRRVARRHGDDRARARAETTLTVPLPSR